MTRDAVLVGDLEHVIAAQGGYFYRWQALDCRFSEEEVAQRLRAQEWTRLRRGAYAITEHLVTLTQTERHVLVARAVVGALEGPVVLSHHSALAVQGVPLWGVAFDEVHVHRGEDRSSRRLANVVHHKGALPDDQIVEFGGLLVTSPERTVLDLGRALADFEVAVTLADAAQRALDYDPERAAALQMEQRTWIGAPRANRVLRFADARSESIGESRTRVLMFRLGLPKPDLQREIRDPAGRFVARTDFYIDEYATAVEFDGRQKYTREMSDDGHGRDPAEMVWREKRREDDIRDLGHQVVRVVWFELDGHDRRVRDRFDRAFVRSGRCRPA